MATGGIFTIITNDGKQDRMLMATAFLHDRLNTIKKRRQGKNGGRLDDLVNLPTLLDIEQTHILFTNAHFKPFAAIGFEYNKVTSTSGSPTLGSVIQFSIPQFGDFFHDMACHVVLDQPKLAPDIGVAASNEPLMRWCDFPGERLLKRVQQEVNGNPLDEYSYHATNMHREYRVATNKRLGWNRCVGQQEPQKGWMEQPNWSSSGLASSQVQHRMQANVDVGNQTPTGQKVGQLEMFIPLLFWYNKDVRLAVPSVAIPYGQRFINIELAQAHELFGMVHRGAGTTISPNGSLDGSNVLKTIELYINNIFVNPEVHQIYIKRVGFSLIRVHRQQLYNATSSSENVHLQQLKWPIEYMFIGMKMKSYHVNDLNGEHLDKWHTFHKVEEKSWNSTVHNMSEFEFVVGDGVKTLGVDTSGSLSGNTTLTKDLSVGDLVVVGGVTYTVTTGAASGADVTDVVVSPAPSATVAADATIATAARLLGGLKFKSRECVPTLDDLKINAHGIDIYGKFPRGFFNHYTTYHFGGPNINTPEDCGLQFVPFCLYPGTYQPSGHINISRAREFYVEYNSSVIGSTSADNGTLVIVASAINFLLISDGSAVLRYST